MKIAYCSDLHLEINADPVDFDFPDADYLFLAGDICLVYDLRDAYEFASISYKQRKFLIDVSKKYKQVFWVMGNHEYWDNSLSNTLTDISQFLSDNNISNISFTSRNTFFLGDILLIVTTLWSDVNKGNYMDDFFLTGDCMRDYDKITVRNDNPELPNCRLKVEDTIKIHELDRDFIKNSLEMNKSLPVIVMTHHCPAHTPNKNESYSGRDTLQKFYYCSDMEDLILDNPVIKYWIHGHDHSSTEYKIGETILASNCRGYKGYERLADEFRIKVIEI